MIEVVDLTKTYKKVNVVDHVNLYIEPGEIVGLLGQMVRENRQRLP